MDQTGPAFRYFAEKFPGISVSKIKEGVFIGPQIRKLPNSSTTFSVATRRGRGMISVSYQPIF
jgi:hypothetical protein